MDAVRSLYSRPDTYWSKYKTDVMLASLPWLVAFGVMVFLSYDAVKKQLRENWKDNQCSPIVLPFAGLIMPQPGQTTMQTTVGNFNYCIKKDLSAVVSIALLPIEFVTYAITSALDLMIEGIMAAMKLIAELKSLLGSVGAEIENKLRSVAVPLVLFVAKLRDTLAKVNATVLASVFSTMTIYYIIVSGLLSVTTIVVDLLIAMAAVIAALFILGIVLMLTPAFPVGIALLAVATTALNAIFIPTVVIYVLLQVFMSSVFGKAARPAPAAPKKSNKKKKK
jgi:hypothetical protein